VKRPDPVLEPTRDRLLIPPSMPDGASIGDLEEPRIDRRTLRADRNRIRRAGRERRRAEAAEVRRFTRSARRRRIVAACAVGFLVVSVATPVLLAVSPAFAVRTVTVTGADAQVAAQVRAALAPELGVPIALVDQRRVAAGIAGVDAVERFSVARIPPGTLAVRVVQRTPIAQVKRADGYHLVDAAGVTLGTSAARIPATPLVMAATSGDFPAAAQVLEAMPATILAKVSSVTARSTDDVRLRLKGGRIVLWGSAEDSGAKAVALAAALVKAARGVSVIDVSAPGVVSTR